VDVLRKRLARSKETEETETKHQRVHDQYEKDPKTKHQRMRDQYIIDPETNRKKCVMYTKRFRK